MMLDFLYTLFVSYFRFIVLTLFRTDYRKHLLIKNVTLTNTKLAKELETICQEKNGILSYSEYLDTEQFGKNGYHAQHNEHGTTSVHKNWAKTIAQLCKNRKYTKIIEFGPGEGLLAIETLKIAKNVGLNLTWHGIEVNEEMHPVIKHTFQKEKLENHFGKLVRNITDIAFDNDCLVIFPYSLDSIPPDIFVNTSDKKATPNATIGVSVQNGLLSEQLITDTSLQTKKLSFINGVYTNAQGQQFSLKSWKLFPGQRAYISIQSFATLWSITNKLSGNSSLLIIDEFRHSVFPWETTSLSQPKNLHGASREWKNAQKPYKEAGNNLLYYPFYKDSFVAALHALGFTSIHYDIEQRLAKELIGEKWIGFKRQYYTYAFLATAKTEKKVTCLNLLSPYRSLF